MLNNLVRQRFKRDVNRNTVSLPRRLEQRFEANNGCRNVCETCNAWAVTCTDKWDSRSAAQVCATHDAECKDFHVQRDDWVGQMQRLCQWRYAEYWIRCWKARCKVRWQRNVEKGRSMRFAKSRHFVLCVQRRNIDLLCVSLFVALNCDISFLDIPVEMILQMIFNYRYKDVKMFAIIYKEKCWIVKCVI